MLVGNKIDLENEVTEAQVKEVASEKGMPYILTSTKTGTNVEEVFMTLTQLVNEKEKPVKSESFMLKASQQKTTKKKKCC